MSVTVSSGQGCVFTLLRLIYFFVFGLWFGIMWVLIAWVLCITIIGLPIGLWMLSRLPQVATLQPERQDMVITTTGRVHLQDIEQHNFFVRAIYFVLVGWWFSALWLLGAALLAATVIGIPIAFWMFNRVPTVMTLERT